MNKPLFSTKLLISTTIISSLYLIFTTLLMNSSLAKNTFVGNYGLDYKIRILISLLEGMWTSMSGIGFSLLIVTALLTGVNLSLLSQRIQSLKEQGNLRFVVGGSSLFGIVGSGCAACGLPILALLGLGGSVAYLPLKGLELSYLSTLLLLVSFYILTRTSASQSCNINVDKQMST